MEGQRSKAWFQKKHKRWGASTIKDLMKEGRVVAKKDGGDGELKYMWGDKAKTALFTMFYERLTGIMRKQIDPTAAMQRGIDLEPLSIERFGELYPAYTLMESEEIVDTGFILFPDDDGTKEWESGYKGENASAGASPDNLLWAVTTRDVTEIRSFEQEASDSPLMEVVDEKLSLVSGIETKARGEEATHSHAYAPFDEDHPDFPQVMCQMHVTGAEYWYYLNFDDEKPEDWGLDVKYVPRSQSYIDKMVKKIKISDQKIEEWIKRCDGISAMMPHKKGELLTEIRNEIRDLKEMW